MTIERYIQGAVLRPYEKLEIKRLKDDVYEADWFDITKYMMKRGQAKITRKLDTESYGFGNLSLSNAKLKIDNSGGVFFPPNIPNSLFFGFDTRQFTKVRYEAGYIKPDGTKLEEKVFEGLLNEKTIKTDILKGECTFTAIAYESILQERRVPTDRFGVARTVSQIAEMVFDDAEVTKFLTYNPAKVNPKLTITVDEPAEYNGKSIKDVLTKICLLSNSVWYIDDDFELVIQARQSNLNTPFEFVGGNTKDKKVNIIDRFDYDEGYSNFINWIDFKSGGSTMSYFADAQNLKMYGTSAFEIDADEITNNTTKETIANDILADQKVPLRRVALKITYMPNVLNLFDVATIDWNGAPVVSDTMIWNLTNWNDEFYYSTIATGFNLDITIEWVVYGWNYDTVNSTMDVFLVEKNI